MGIMQMVIAGSSPQKKYVEDVFNTYVYKGDGAAETITHGIDLAGEGGMIWMKSRTQSLDHVLWSNELSGYDDQAWGHYLSSNQNGNGDKYYTTQPGSYPQVTSTSHTTGWVNTLDEDYVNWTFRNQKGFFNAVKYTSTETTNVTIPHGLGSVPGMVIIKNIDRDSDWQIWHKSLSSGEAGLNSGIGITFGSEWAFANANIENTAPDSTNFYAKNPGYDANAVTSSLGENYIAYFFAHDDQRFGNDRDESIIKCGAVSISGTGLFDIDLGWEPQYVMMKKAEDNGGSAGITDEWYIYDNMRNLSHTGVTWLEANTLDAEQGFGTAGLIFPYATGFKSTSSNFNQGFYIYMAIRRGPMKTPTDATKVFAPVTYTGDTNGHTVSISPSYTDLTWIKRLGSSDPHILVDRLRSEGNQYISSDDDSAEGTLDANDLLQLDKQNGFGLVANTTGYTNSGGQAYISWNFKRAPGFFDIVCYDGTVTTVQTVNHNLGVVPEMMIHKARTSAMDENWAVYHKDLSGANYYLQLNTDDDENTNAGMWDNTAPTATHFTVGNDNQTNANGGTFVAYLFASCPGVSKVGTYTGAGSGTDVNVDCGFTAGARFVLIKAQDQAGHWFVYDTTRGINAGNDPFGKLNSSSAYNDGVTNGEDRIDTYNPGFTVSGSDVNHNVSGDTYIYLAIA